MPDKDFDIKDTILGKKAVTPENYDASLLFRIPRAENRIKYGLDEADLPFIGYDTWNCYEISFLTKNGLPVSRVVKLIYPATSQYLVESKSLKLYLNSFNMERFEESVSESEKIVKDIIKTDLSNLLESPVNVSFFDNTSPAKIAFEDIKNDLTELVSLEKLESISFTHFEESPQLLSGSESTQMHRYSFHSDLLRSNCRVTNQPDWGDLFVKIETSQEIDLYSIIAYLISFRKENHFHEEVVEMIYKRFYDKFKPKKLMVAAMYTRRGGIDINPIRASHHDLLDSAFLNPAYRLEKTLRQ